MNHIENVHGDVRSKSGSLSDGKPKTQVSIIPFLILQQMERSLKKGKSI